MTAGRGSEQAFARPVRTQLNEAVGRWSNVSSKGCWICPVAAASQRPAQPRHHAKTALAAHDARREDLERRGAALPIAELDRLYDLAARRRALREAATKVGEQLAALPPAPRWRTDRHANDRAQLTRGLGEHERALAAVTSEHRQLAEQLADVDPAAVRQQHATLTSQLAEHHKQRDALEAAALVAAANPDPGHQLPPGSTNRRFDRAAPTRRGHSRDAPDLGR